jgi:hypothetical protein
MRRTTILSACTIALLACTGTAFAQRMDAPQTRDVSFTFSQPVIVPNKTLPAGKYLFRLVDSSRTIVQIYAGDGSKLVHTAMSAQVSRSDQPEKPEIRLIESSADTPVAIGSWWYPEMRQGWEFIYPRSQAVTIAKTAKQPVLTTAQNTPADNVSSGDLVRLDSSGQQVPYSPNQSSMTGTAQIGEVTAADAAANRVAAAMTERPDTRASASAPISQSARAELPRTASNMPVVGLVALIALSAALGLGIWRRIA